VRARAAVAALCRFVAVSAHLQTIVFVVHAKAGELQLESRLAAVTEHVVITKDPKHVDPGFILIYEAVMLGSQDSPEREAHLKASPGTNIAFRAAFSIKRRGERFGNSIHWEKHNFGDEAKIAGGGLPGVLETNLDNRSFPDLKITDSSPPNINVGAELPLRGPFSASYKANGSSPQHQRDYRKQPFAGFDAEYRDLRSVLAAVLTLLFATWIYLRGWSALGWAAAAYGIFGLLLRLDLWSLAVRVM
jgi:hypothetical protein